MTERTDAHEPKRFVLHGGLLPGRRALPLRRLLLTGTSPGRGRLGRRYLFSVKPHETLDRRPYTIVYDGDCRVCERSVQLLRQWDRTGLLEIVASQDPGVHARFPWIPEHAYAESLQLIGPGGRTWQGAAALEQLFTILPRGRLFSWVFRIPFARVIAERLYRWFARNRYRLGCAEHCQYSPRDPTADDSVKH